MIVAQLNIKAGKQGDLQLDTKLAFSGTIRRKIYWELMRRAEGKDSLYISCRGRHALSWRLQAAKYYCIYGQDSSVLCIICFTGDRSA